MKKGFFSLMVFLLLVGVANAFASGTQPAGSSHSSSTDGKVSQLVNVGGTAYVAVLENGSVTAFFFQPDPPGDASDAFDRAVLKDAYDGNTSTWTLADKELCSKGKAWYEYDGKTYKKLHADKKLETTESCS